MTRALVERWARLPREARDVLFLLFVIGWTVLPHLPNLPAWCGLLALVLLGWRGVLAVRGEPLPSRIWLAAVLFGAALLTWRSHGTLVGKDPGVTMAVVLMGLKTLELRARRDAFVVFFLGFFLVLTHFFYSQTIATAAAMLIATWGLLTALVLAHMPAGRPALAIAGRQALRAALYGAPLMLLLFVLFPRIGPLWGTPQEMVGKTGLSGTMQLGAMAEIANDDSIAFRVRFVAGSRAPPPEAMYWRGPVLTLFDGREWRALRGAGSSPRSLQVSGEPLHYELTLEPSRLPLLPLLEATPMAPALDADDGTLRPQRRDDLTWTLQRPLLERTRLVASAFPNFRQGAGASRWELQEALDLPADHNPRTLQWAAAQRAALGADADADALARAVLQHIRTGEFSYTLSPGTYGDGAGGARSIVDEFWLDRKAGFCEHYAAAFVVVMRAMGVPARVVTGYQGADPLVVDGFHIVRQSYAHAWAEYWREGSGWRRADPTAAVAPDRIARSLSLSPQRGAVTGVFNAMSPNLLAQLRAGWEAFDNRWNQWVLNYSRGQQLQTLRNLGFDGAQWQDLALLLIGVLSALALGAAGWAFVEHRRQDPWTRLLARMRRQLARVGVPAPAHAGPLQLAGALRERADGGALADWLAALDRARYGAGARTRPARGAWREFLRHARPLRGR